MVFANLLVGFGKSLSGFRNGELPVDGDSFLLTLAHQSQHFASESVLRGNATVEALARERGELNFDHVEPGSTLGSEEELEALRQSEGFWGGKGFVKRADVMGVEIVLHQSNLESIGKAAGQFLEEEGIFVFGALGVNLGQMRTSARFDGRQ